MNLDTDTAPREFWIDSILNIDKPHTKTAYIHKQDCEKIKGNAIHVIEFSAYLDMKKQRDALAAEVERLKEKYTQMGIN